MTSDTINNVADAFDILLAEIEAQIGLTEKASARAIEQHDYDQARGMLERAGQLAAFRERVTALRVDWDKIPGLPTEKDAGLKQDLAALEKRFGALVEAEPEIPAGDGKRFKKGLKTPMSAYQRPILQALVELGGSSDLHAVLERVFAKMKGQLNSHDLAPLPSDGITPRWQNTAQWARHALREGGFLRSDSPHGVWEISEKGREWLAGLPR